MTARWASASRSCRGDGVGPTDAPGRPTAWQRPDDVGADNLVTGTLAIDPASSSRLGEHPVVVGDHLERDEICTP